MKFKFLQLRKVLLVAAGLLVGASVQKAQAETINATLVHTASSYSGETENVFTSTVDAEKEHINNTKRNAAWAGCAYAEFSFEIPEGQVVTSAKLTFTGVGSSKARTTDVMYVNVGETLDYTSLSDGTANVDLGANLISTVTFNANATANFTTDVTDALKVIVGGEQQYIIFKFTNNIGGGDLKGKGSDSAPNLVIETASASSTTSYTVNFLDAQSSVLKTPAVYTGQLVDAEVTASEDDMASFKNEDESKKYIYESGNETIKLVADANQNIINLVFREAGEWNYTINAVANSEVVSEITTGTEFEGETVKYYFPYYILSGDDLYKGSKNSSGDYFGNSFTLNADNTTISLAYAKVDGITDVVYLKEAEAIETMTPADNGYINSRCSNGLGAYAAEDALITTLEPGKYKLMTASYASTSTTFTFKAGDVEILSHTGSGGFSEAETEKEFVIYSSTDITVKGGSTNYALDYVLIYKTGDIENVPVTIGETGYTTFSSTFSLDLDKLPSGVTAYYASEVNSDNTAIILKEATGQVAAGTGLIFAGEAKSYNIPVTASGSAIEGNLLKGCTSETTLTKNENQYVLVNNDGTAEFQSLADNGATIPAGKAYLEVSADASRSLGITFGDDDTTGIVEVEKANIENGAIYNLNGQRVIKPTNGLYIMNGKKVIIK